MGFLGGSRPYWTRWFAPNTMVRRSSRSRRLVSTESWPSATRAWCNASATSRNAPPLMSDRREVTRLATANRMGAKYSSMAPSTYCDAKTRASSARAQRDAVLVPVLRQL